MYELFGMYGISASTLLLSKQLLVHSSPLFLSGIRTLMGGTLLLGYVWLSKRSFLNFKALMLPCFGIAVYSFFLSNTLKFWALQHTVVAHAAIVSSVELWCASVFAYYLFNERITIAQGIGIALCMSSVWLLGQNQVSAGPGYHLISWPTFFLCVAAAFSAYGALLMRKLIKYQQACPILVMGMSMAIAGFLSLAATSTEVSSCTLETANFLPFMGNFFALVMLSNLIAYSLYGSVISRYSAVFIACSSCMRPFFTALYECFLCNQAISWQVLGGVGLLIMGLVIVYQDERSGVWQVKSF